MVFAPNSRESCEYYNVDFDTKKRLSDEEIERKNYETQRVYEDSVAKPITKSLMPKTSGGSHDYFPQQSRDYALSHTIPCVCTLCPANKNSYCEVPSLIKINASGQCTTGLAFVKQERDGTRDPDTLPTTFKDKTKFTPDWFFNKWEKNCPYLNKSELEDYKKKMKFVDDTEEQWCYDVITLNEREN